MQLRFTRLVGGGQSWFYLVDANQCIHGSAHQDDKPAMDRLDKLAKDRTNG